MEIDLQKIYKTVVQPFGMLIHKPFILLAASVMDIGPLQTSSEAFALALHFHFPVIRCHLPNSSASLWLCGF